MPASRPCYFPLAKSPLYFSPPYPSTSLALIAWPASSLPAPRLPSGDPSAALATAFYSPRVGRAQAERLTQPRSPEEDNARCPASACESQGCFSTYFSASPPQTSEKFCSIPLRKGLAKQIPPGFLPSLTTRHEKRSSFSPGNAGKSLQHQRHHTRAIPPSRPSHAAALGLPPLKARQPWWLRRQLHSRHSFDFFFCPFYLLVYLLFFFSLQTQPQSGELGTNLSQALLWGQPERHSADGGGLLTVWRAVTRGKRGTKILPVPVRSAPCPTLKEATK